MGTAQKSIETLAPNSVAALFARSELTQARAEAGNREFDECVDLAEKALDEVRHPHHQVPGETLPIHPALR